MQMSLTFLSKKKNPTKTNMHVGIAYIASKVKSSMRLVMSPSIKVTVVCSQIMTLWRKSKMQ